MVSIAKGYQVVTAGNSAVVNTSGVPVAIYGVNIISDGTGGVVTLRNGTTGSATAVIQLNGTASVGVYVDLGVGLVFPNGCFVSIDAHVTPQCTVVYETLK